MSEIQFTIDSHIFKIVETKFAQIFSISVCSCKWLTASISIKLISVPVWAGSIKMYNMMHASSAVNTANNSKAFYLIF